MTTPDHHPVDDHELVDRTGRVIYLGTRRRCRHRRNEIGARDRTFARGCVVRPVVVP